MSQSWEQVLLFGGKGVEMNYPTLFTSKLPLSCHSLSYDVLIRSLVMAAVTQL